MVEGGSMSPYDERRRNCRKSSATTSKAYEHPLVRM
jgi:hypothetical protein